MTVKELRRSRGTNRARGVCPRTMPDLNILINNAGSTRGNPGALQSHDETDYSGLDGTVTRHSDGGLVSVEASTFGTEVSTVRRGPAHVPERLLGLSVRRRNTFAGSTSWRGG